MMLPLWVLILLSLFCHAPQEGARLPIVVEEYRLPDEVSIPADEMQFFNTYRDSLIPAMRAKRAAWRHIDNARTVKSHGGPPESDYLSPFLLGGVEYRLVRMITRHTPNYMEDEADFIVTRDGKTMYSFTGRGTPADHIARAFFPWNGTWVLEYTDHVVVGGVDLNERHHYSKTFFYRVIGGKPIYFAVLNGRTRICFDGKLLSNEYDEVIHYKCCGYSVFNPESWNSMIDFYARRDGQSYYVEAGIFQ